MSTAATVSPPVDGKQLKKGLIRVGLFAGVVVILIIAVPGLGSIRGKLAHGELGWVAIAAGLRLASACSYVVLFRAIFSPSMPWRLAWEIAMTEIGLNALVPSGGTGGLAVGGWVLHHEGMETDTIVKRSAELFVFTSAFNVTAVAILGWLGVIGIIGDGASLVFSLVPAVIATVIVVGAALLANRVPTLESDEAKQRSHSPLWWVYELLATVGSGAQGAVSLFRERNLRAILGGAGYLVFDIATLWAAVHAFHVAPNVIALALAYLIGQLAGEIPVPGGIGAVDGGLIGAMVVYGIQASAATAGAVAYRAIALGVPTLFGAIAGLGLTRTVRRWDHEAAGATPPAAELGIEPGEA